MSQAGNFLLRGSLGTGMVQIVSIGLTFLTTAALARTLGKEGFGIYSFALTWSLLLLGPATFGFGPVITRETAAGIELSAWDRVYGVYRYAIRTTALSLSALLPFVLLGCALAWYTLGSATATALGVGIVVLALGAAMAITRHRLFGLRRVVTAQLAESVMRPGLLLLLLLAVARPWEAQRAPFDAASALALYAAASGITLLFLLWQVRSALVAHKAPTPGVLTTDEDWRGAGRALLLTGIARDLNAEAGVLIMGTLLPAADVGLYRAAQRLASLPTYVLTAINLSFQPVAAALFAKGDVRTVEILGVRSSRVSLLLSLPLIAAFFLAGDRLLSVFGEGFEAAYPALCLLSVGHLFNVSCGSVGVILVAAKRERDAAKGLVISCVVTLVATAVGIWWAGLLGAAAATAIGLFVWNILLSWFTWERLGILPAAFSWRWRRW